MRVILRNWRTGRRGRSLILDPILHRFKKFLLALAIPDALWKSKISRKFLKKVKQPLAVFLYLPSLPLSFPLLEKRQKQIQKTSGSEAVLLNNWRTGRGDREKVKNGLWCTDLESGSSI